MSLCSRSLMAAITTLIVAAPAIAAPPPPVFIETWENAADATTKWRVNTANDADSTGDLGNITITTDAGSSCSTSFQRETFAAHTGRAFTSTPNGATNIALGGASAYCVTAWIRGSSSPYAAPFLGIANDTATGAATLTYNFLMGTLSVPTQVTPDGAWHWYTADYTSSGAAGDTVYIDLVDELWDGQNSPGNGSAAGATADFDDIAIWPGTCADLVTALGGTPPTHQTCGGTTAICETTSSDPQYGQCVQCDVNNDCSGTPSTPICRNHGCVAGCLDDSGCPTAGQICDSGSNQCVAGCRGGASARACPTGQFCTSETSAAGMCTTACDFTDQCPAGQICAASSVDAGPSNCVECVSAADCHSAGKPACSSTFVCVECTAGDRRACSAGGSGSACLANQTCGCTSDADCGGSMSGRICDAGTSKCVAGCRGAGGNGCPAGMQCSSGDTTAGSCSGIPPVVDMAMIVDMAMPEGADLSLPVAGDLGLVAADDLGPPRSPDLANGNGGSGGSTGLSGGGGGCSCDVSGASDGSGALFLLFAFAFVLRRRLGVRF